MDEYKNPRVKITFDFDHWEDRRDMEDLIMYRKAYVDLNEIYDEARVFLKHGDLTDVEEVERLLERIKELSWRE